MQLRGVGVGAEGLVQWSGFEDGPLVGLVSVRVHAPGQRQTADVEVWYRLRREVDGLDDRQIRADFERLTDASRELGPRQRRIVVDWARGRLQGLVSPHDQTADHGAEAAGIGRSEANTFGPQVLRRSSYADF